MLCVRLCLFITNIDTSQPLITSDLIDNCRYVSTQIDIQQLQVTQDILGRSFRSICSEVLFGFAEAIHL